MTRQAPESAAALFSRLQPHFDDRPRTDHVETAAGQANWRPGWGRDIPDVKTVVIHTTDGWPTRDKAGNFVDLYTNPNATPANKRGVGPHFYMPYDGTVYRLLSENRQCWHANHVNGWAIGVETGNLTSTGHPTGAGGPWPRRWTQLSTDAEDLPRAKLYAILVNHEILISAWSTGNAVQADAHASGHIMMWLSEAQYRSWALLARWLCEVWRIPRNFPVRPHLMRSYTWQANRWRTYREVVDADPMRDAHLRNELNVPPYNCTEATFEDDTPATGLPHVYGQGVATTTWTTTNGGAPTTHHKQVNNLWTALFQSYRGFHGHGFSGANTGEDHNCPGAWFDWHRFAREVWDYWWYPFDLAWISPANGVASGQPRRDAGQSSGVLREHYFDEDPSLFGRVTTSGFFPIGDETVVPHMLPGPPTGLIGEMVRMYRRYWGFWHGGMHFQLDAGSPIYAMAAGQLVAARLSLPAGGIERDGAASPHPSARFVLLRHEVFFRRRGGSDRLDYDQEPLRVYSLYMHLGSPAGLDTEQAATANPTWLNRALAMKKEYDLGLAFRDHHTSAAPEWVPHVTRWQRQRAALDPALADLAAGRIAQFPEGDDAIRVALGDFLGTAGHLAANTSGLHIEIFSRDAIDDPWFERVDPGAGATRAYHDEQNLDDVTAFLRNHVPAPAGSTGSADIYRDLPPEQKASRFQTIALRNKSEWALDRSDFPDGGWDTASDLMWWQAVVPAMNTALAADPASQLPADAVVWHYHPLGFLAWLNELTWRSEWPKYRVTDAAGVDVPVPPRPPPRR